MEFEQEWGRWATAFYFLAALALCAGSGGFAFLVYLIATAVVPPPNQPIQAQNFVWGNFVWEGFAVGMLLGFLAGAALIKGIHQLANGIESLRGDPVSRTLLEYHEAMLGLVHDAGTLGRAQPNP